MSISADQVFKLAAHPIAQLNDIDLSSVATITIPFINGGDFENHVVNFIIIEHTAGTIGIAVAQFLANTTFALTGSITLTDAQGGRIPYLPKQDEPQPTTGIIEIDITTASLDPTARINVIITGFSI